MWGWSLEYVMFIREWHLWKKGSEAGYGREWLLQYRCNKALAYLVMELSRKYCLLDMFHIGPNHPCPIQLPAMGFPREGVSLGEVTLSSWGRSWRSWLIEAGWDHSLCSFRKSFFEKGYGCHISCLLQMDYGCSGCYILSYPPRTGFCYPVISAQMPAVIVFLYQYDRDLKFFWNK